MHEFEALVFCGLEHLLIDYPDMTKQIASLQKIVAKYDNNTEKIDDNPQTAPSKRIIKEFEKFHNYNKVKSGVLITSQIGIKKLKDKCLHFKEWIEKLEKLSIVNNDLQITPQILDEYEVERNFLHADDADD